LRTLLSDCPLVRHEFGGAQQQSAPPGEKRRRRVGDAAYSGIEWTAREIIMGTDLFYRIGCFWTAAAGRRLLWRGSTRRFHRESDGQLEDAASSHVESGKMPLLQRHRPDGARGSN
jgi:hypothetical protein